MCDHLIATKPGSESAPASTANDDGSPAGLPAVTLPVAQFAPDKQPAAAGAPRQAASLSRVRHGARSRVPQACLRSVATVRQVLACAASSLLLLAPPVAADDITLEMTQFQSLATRKEIRAQLTEFKRAGPPPWSISYNPLRSFMSTFSRTEVRREMAASRTEMQALHGEDSGSVFLRQVKR